MSTTQMNLLILHKLQSTELIFFFWQIIVLDLVMPSSSLISRRWNFDMGVHRQFVLQEK